MTPSTFSNVTKQEASQIQIPENTSAPWTETAWKLGPLAISIVLGGLSLDFIPGAQGIIVGFVSVGFASLITWNLFRENGPYSKPTPSHPVVSPDKYSQIKLRPQSFDTESKSTSQLLPNPNKGYLTNPFALSFDSSSSNDKNPRLRRQPDKPDWMP